MKFLLHIAFYEMDGVAVFGNFYFLLFLGTGEVWGDEDEKLVLLEFLDGR